MADDSYDPFSEASPEEKNAALARILRGQQPGAAIQQQRQLGNLGSLIGGPLQGVGQSLTRDADTQQQLATTSAYRQALVDNTASRNASQDEYRKALEALKTQDQADQENHAGKYAPKNQNVTTDTGIYAVNPLDPTQKTKIGDPLRKVGKGGAGKGGGGGAPSGPGEIYPGVTQDLLDHWSDELNAGHGYPKSAMNKAGQPLAKLIETNAFRRDPKNSAAVAGAGFGSDKKSLDKATEQFDATNGFIGTFDKNIGQLEKTIADLRSSNSPFLNKGLRWYQTNVEGDPKLSAFKTALTTVNSEGAKINSGQTGGGGTPISVIQEMEHNLPPDATPEQILTALRVLRQDSENRRASLQKNLGDIRGRMGGKPTGGTGGSAAPATDGPVKLISVDGKPFTAPNADVAQKAIASKKYRMAP